MEVIQIVLGIIIIAIGVNLFIVVNNLSKDSDERSTLSKILGIGYVAAGLIILAGVAYIVMHLIWANDAFSILDLFG